MVKLDVGKRGRGLAANCMGMFSTFAYIGAVDEKLISIPDLFDPMLKLLRPVNARKGRALSLIIARLKNRTV